jgi:lipopolysaccharide biosynthesis glycosyltransferase
MNNEVLKVFIGFDPRQPIAYTVLNMSIVKRSSKPVSITPLIIEQLPIERTGLTTFTFSRFLVPYLCNYEGWALFLDADMLVQEDIADLFAMADDKYAVMVSKNELKFEWASAVLFNCAKCKILTPEYVEKANGMHTMNFVDESEVGEFPGTWNHLVGYDEPRQHPALIHYTQGVPVWPETNDCEHAHIYAQEAQHCVAAKGWQEIMGPSVHAGQDENGNRVPLYKLKPEYKNAQASHTS